MHHNQLTEQEEFERKRMQVQLKDEAKTDKNRAKREKKKLAALKAQAAAKGRDPAKVSIGNTESRTGGEPEAKKPRLHDSAVERIQFRQKDTSDDESAGEA